MDAKLLQLLDPTENEESTSLVIAAGVLAAGGK